jgi:hypothetical protein
MSNRLRYKERFIGCSGFWSGEYLGTNGNEAVGLKPFPFGYFSFSVQQRMILVSFFLLSFFHIVWFTYLRHLELLFGISGRCCIYGLAKGNEEAHRNKTVDNL